ncbi:MAG: hypothetical protein AAFQ52_15715, partial [Chloroflexota bacterium]
MRRLLSLIMILVFAFAIAPQATFACSPPPDYMNYTLADRVENAPIIFTGTITQGFLMFEDTPYYFISDALIEVDTVYKGEAQAIEHMYGFGQGPDCASVVNLGDTYLFFAERDDDGTLDAVYLTIGDAAWGVSESAINTVVSITGQQDAPIPLPLQDTMLLWIETHVWWLVGVGVGITLLLMLYGWVKRR